MHLATACRHHRLAPVPVMMTRHSTQGAHVMHHAGRVGPLQRITATAVRVYRRDVVHALMKIFQLERGNGTEIRRIILI